MASSATPSAPAGTAFDFCGAIDLDAATKTAKQFPRYRQASGGVSLAHRAVSTAWSVRENTVTEISELCDYGFDDERTTLILQAFPAGRDRDVPDRAKALPELGKGAYFRQSSDFFTLGAPAGRSYLLLTGQFTSASEPTAAERALRGLMEHAIAAVPADAVLEGKVGGDHCASLEQAATAALGAAVDYSRYVKIGSVTRCAFTAVETGARASIASLPGQASRYRRGSQEPVKGLENAWRSKGTATVVRGDDAIVIHLSGAGGSAERDGNGDYTKDDELARAVTAVLLP